MHSRHCLLVADLEQQSCIMVEYCRASAFALINLVFLAYMKLFVVVFCGARSSPKGYWLRLMRR